MQMLNLATIKSKRWMMDIMLLLIRRKNGYTKLCLISKDAIH
jgi:hypothetical protein